MRSPLPRIRRRPRSGALCVGPAVAVAIAVATIAGSAAGNATPSTAEDGSDPYFGEALFHAHQGDFFSALERLDAELAQHYRVDERSRDSLYAQIDDAEFSVGDFELRYRMHQRAGRAMHAVLEGAVDEDVRADAAYRLARLYLQKAQPDAALSILDRMPETSAASLREDAAFVRANALLAVGRPEVAAESLRPLERSARIAGFAHYNLAISRLRTGEVEAAVQSLDRAGRIDADERALRALRDKANLLLGTLLFEAEEFERAQQVFDRVRLAGPYSNDALLRAGWSEASSERFERAVVPWSILAERDPTDAAVQEALLALPYAYSRLNFHGRAAILYEQAATAFGNELAKLDASIASVEEGAFLRALEREEIRQDADWVVRLRRLPDAPETHYLVSLMASHAFQNALQNYLDLADMRRKLRDWRRSLDAFEEVIALRRDHHEPRLPALDGRFRELDARMRVRIDHARRVRERLEAMLTSPAPSMLATSGELADHARLVALEAAIDRSAIEDDSVAALRARVRRLRGVLTWSRETRYHERLTDVHDDLRELNADVEQLHARYDSFVRARQAATHSFEGYDGGIRGLRARIERAADRIEALRERQGRALERVARSALVARRERIHGYQNKARFAFADSYDRAAKRRAP